MEEIREKRKKREGGGGGGDRVKEKDKGMRRGRNEKKGK